MTRRPILLTLLRLAPLMLLAGCASCSAPQPNAGSAAARLLDDAVAEEARAALARQRVDDAADVLAAMVEELEPGTEEEYRRIPWIWRVSRAAGESNDDEVIVEILDISTPHDDEPLHDWQAVVLGGGIVSGLSAAGEWPRERIESLIEAHATLPARFGRAIEHSAEMADDETVPDPTRYDALRLVAMAGWEEASPQLVRYLGTDVHAELQMGAVSGLSDINAPEVDSTLLRHFDGFTAYNRQLALDGLLRTDERASALLDAVEQGSIEPDSVGADHIKRLREHPAEPIRSRGRRIVPDA